MDMIGRGIIAGFLATLALSTVIDPMNTVARLASMPPSGFAWMLHFFVGSFIWGAGFALLQSFLRGPAWVRGMIFGALAWVVVMACMGAGVFGHRVGVAAEAVMLAVHLTYGILIGAIFGVLGPLGSDAEPHDHEPNGNHLHPLHR